MLEGEVFQQPRTPAVKETNMKKKPTMKRAIMARFISAKVKCKKSLDVIKEFFNFQLTDSCHLLSIEVVGDAILVRDVVVKVAAPGLHGAHIEVKGLALGGFRFLARVALPEETSGPCEVEG